MICFFFFEQKTAYEITEGDWSSDVCSSDLSAFAPRGRRRRRRRPRGAKAERSEEHTSELQSPSVISYAVFCSKKKKQISSMSLIFLSVKTLKGCVKRL